MKSLHVLSLVAAGITLGGVGGFTFALVTMPEPKPIVQRIQVLPAGLQISCSSRDWQEYHRACAARKRMESVK